MSKEKYELNFLDGKFYINKEEVTEEDIKNILKKVDNIIIPDRSIEILLSNDDIKINIKNASNFKKIVDKLTEEKIRNKKIKRNKTAGIILVGSLAFSMLANNYFNNKNKNEKQPINEEITNDEIKLNPFVDFDLNSSLGKLTDLKYILDTDSDEEVSSVESESEKLVKQDEFELPVYEYYLDLRIEPSDDYEIDENVKAYDEIIEDESKKWGFSPNIIRSMICHESAGEDENLTQVIFKSWKNQVITTFNFEENREYSIILTDHPERFVGKVDKVITYQEFLEPRTNILVANVILSSLSDKYNNNLALTFMGYNFGSERLRRIMERYSIERGITIDDVINNPENTDFIEYVTNFDESKVKQEHPDAIEINDGNYDITTENVYVIGDVKYVYNLYRKNYNQLPYERTLRDGSKIVTTISYDMNLIKSR